MTPAQLCRLHPTSKTVLLHLNQHGSLSHAEALTVYGLPKVAKQIWELRQNGTEVKTDLRKDATGRRYARYTIRVTT